MEEIATQDHIEEADITVTIIQENGITENQEIVVKAQALETFTTEHLQVGTHRKLGVTPSERGNRTCRFGYI